MCNIELKVDELQLFITKILEFPRFHIFDFDLTLDVSGHLDYEMAKEDLIKTDPRIGIYMPTPKCGT